MGKETTPNPVLDISKLEGDGTGSADYYRERLERAKAGEATWIRRNYDADLCVYDFYSNRRTVGCLVEDDVTLKFEVFVGQQGETSLSEQPIELNEAVQLVEDYARTTSN